MSHNNFSFILDANNKKRVKRAKPRQKVQKLNIPKEPKTLLDDKWDWNGSLFPFKGTSSLYNTSKKEITPFDDTEWNSDTECDIMPDPASCNNIPPVNVNVVKNGLNLLMGTYSDSENSDNDDNIKDTKNSCNEPLETKREIKCEIITYDSDNQEPQEEKIIYNDHSNTETNFKNENKQIKINKGKRVRESHENKQKSKRLQENKNIYHKQNKPTLLEELLKDEIRHERNVLLQCVRYVVNNNFFQTS